MEISCLPRHTFPPRRPAWPASNINDEEGDLDSNLLNDNEEDKARLCKRKAVEILAVPARIVDVSGVAVRPGVTCNLGTSQVTAPHTHSLTAAHL